MRTKRLTLVFLVISVGLYLLTRLYNLTLLPIFFDEANFIYWAERIYSGVDGWFLPLSGGKNVSLPWLTVLAMHVFSPSNFLFSGRMVSVLAGLLTMFGTFFLGKLIFKSSKIGLLAVTIYVFCPFTLFYDRMALYDSLLTAGIVWTIYFTIKTAIQPTWKNASFWGISLGLTHLAKATAIFYSLLTPFIYLIYTDKKPRKLVPILISFLVSQIIANFFIFSRGFFEYQQKALAHTPGASSLITSPFVLFFENLTNTFFWIKDYLTLPFLFLSICALIFVAFTAKRFFLVLIVAVFLPIISMCFVGREYFPRYLVFITPFLAVSASYFVIKFFKKPLLFFILLVVFGSFLLFDKSIWKNPEKAPLPEIDKWQYVSGFPSGYGLRESIEYLENISRKGTSVTVVTQGSYSHYPNAYHLAFGKYKNVTVLERWPLVKIDQEIIKANKETDLYIIFRDDYKANEKMIFKKLPVSIIKTFTKPGNQDSVYVTRLN